MKRLILTLVAILALSSAAYAIPMTFTDTTYFSRTGTNAPEDYIDHGWGDVNMLNGMGDFVSWRHQFTPVGQILSGTLTLHLRDDANDPLEIALGWGEDGTWGVGEVDTGAYNFSINVASLADGIFNVTLVSLWGDFFIDSSDLVITYNSAPVPEPGTLLLLGSGLVGMVSYGRLRMKM